MVASDTVVGLVGAGILLVALVGVFAYESQQGGTAGSEALAYKSANVHVTGTYQLGGQQGTPSVMNNPPCTAPACYPAKRNADLAFEGLPGSNGGCYQAFLQNAAGTTNVAIGDCMKPVAGKASAKTASDTNGATFTKVIVTLESATATNPGPVKLLEFAVTPTPASTPNPMNPTAPSQPAPVPTKPVDQNAAVQFVPPAGNQTVKFTPEAGGTNVTVSLTKMPIYSGYTYRGWMIKAANGNETWTFVGNFTADGKGTTVSGNITGNVPGAKDDYSEFVITLEPIKAFMKTMPMGPETLDAEYNAPKMANLT